MNDKIQQPFLLPMLYSPYVRPKIWTLLFKYYKMPWYPSLPCGEMGAMDCVLLAREGEAVLPVLSPQVFFPSPTSLITRAQHRKSSWFQFQNDKPDQMFWIIKHNLFNKNRQLTLQKEQRLTWSHLKSKEAKVGRAVMSANIWAHVLSTPSKLFFPKFSLVWELLGTREVG